MPGGTGRYREVLNYDIRFLHGLLPAYSGKLKLFSTFDVNATIEERVVLYMQMAPGQVLNGSDDTVFQLRCSRRQLQRVLKKLCANGRVKKIGRGSYQLLECWGTYPLANPF